MDYKKFNRTNAVIETVGSIAAAVWAVINLFLAESNPVIPLLSITVAGLIKNSRCFMLTEREDYQHAENQKNSYTDNRTLYIISAVCSCAALALVIVKMIIR